MGLPYEEAPGEAAFYGPKADFIVRDCISRQWRLGRCSSTTCSRNTRSRVHQARQPAAPARDDSPRYTLGSMERFIGILIRGHLRRCVSALAGAPEQVRVLPISDKVAAYARQVLDHLLENGFRASVDLRAEKVEARIRDAQLEKVPVMLVVGVKEAENQGVSYRDRVGGDLGAMPLTQAIDRLESETHLAPD